MKVIFVPGKPVPQPRQRTKAFMRGGKMMTQNYTPNDAPVQAWKQAIALRWRDAFGANPAVDVPLYVELIFWRSRPASKTRKTNDRMWDRWHVGDADNLAKAVLDALEGLAYKDDCQVAELRIERHVCGDGDEPGVQIEIKELQK